MKKSSHEFIQELGAYVEDQEKLLSQLNKYLKQVQSYVADIESNIDEMKKAYNAEIGFSKPVIKRIK